MLAFRSPAVVLAVAAAALILACASSSGALFLSSASSEALRRIVAADCPDTAYPAIDGTAGSTDPFESPMTLSDTQVRSAMTGAGIPATEHVLRTSDPVGLTGPAGGSVNPANVLFRDDALANVKVLERGPAAGIWLPATLARQLGARPGGSVGLGPVDDGQTTRIAVAGIYEDLWRQPTQPYWCSYAPLFQNFSYGNDAAPPPLALASDPSAYEEASLGGGTSATERWVSAIDTSGMTLSRAEELAGRQAEAYVTLHASPPTDTASRSSGPGQIPIFAEQTRLIRSGLRGPVVPIALGGTILALLLVGAAGSYWADRRAREVRLLSSRGVGPAALALKAVLELALAAVVGTLLGWLLARWLVGAVGPSPDLDPDAPRQALLTAGVALLAGLTLLALVAGLRSRNATERPIGARRSWVVLVPWELTLLIAAGLCWLQLRDSGAVVLERNVAQISLLVVAFPLLFIVGGAVFVVRLLALLLPAAGRLAGRRSPAWYLAGRRVTASRVVSVTLLAAASTPVAVLVYAATLTQTSQYTLDAKAKVYVGATQAVQSVDPMRRTPETDRVGTLVTRYLYATVEGSEVAVLAVDPDTFAGSAFWDRRFAGVPLDALLEAIRRPAADGRVAAVLMPAGDLADHGVGDRYDIALGKTTATLEVVATAATFPGRRVADPVIVIDVHRLGTVDPFAGSLSELWTRGSSDEAQTVVLGQDARVYDVASLDEVFQAANFVGISWTFGYLSALAALVGLVAVGGLLLYLETRQRARVASYALGRRMGLTRGTHLRSLLAELGTLLVAAFAVGAALAWTAVLMVYGSLDVDTYRPPAPLLTTPTAALVGAGAGTVVVVLLATLYAQRSADRADVAEVLRLGS